MQKSLGLIETQGLAGGIEAADAAVKSANVELIGYELTRGGGWTTVKIQGDVGAVKAAVDAARIAAGKVTRVVSTRVIPRPAAGLERLIRSADTVGWKPPEPPADPEPPAPPEPPAGPDEPEKEEPVPPAEEADEAETPAVPGAEEVPIPAEEPAPEIPEEEPSAEEAAPGAETPAAEEAAPAKPRTARKTPAKRGGKRKQ